MVVVATLALHSCSNGTPGGGGTSAPTSSGPSTSGPSTSTPAPVPALDCTATEPSCPAIELTGDPPASLSDGRPSPVRGYADPSVRSDPTSSRLWMAYSWPGIEGSGTQRSTSVEIHLAHSDDGGGTWVYDDALWTPEPAVDPVTGRSGSTDHEVANLLPVAGEDGAVTWYAARLNLFSPDSGGFAARPTDSFRISVGQASDPAGLASADMASLGAARTDSRWGVDQDLSELDPAVEGCSLWNEPALHHDGDELFMVLRCLPLDTLGMPTLTESSLEVFATVPIGAADDWEWRYAGRLAGGEEAAELGGEGLTQAELAFDEDGSLLALVTPDSYLPAQQQFAHHGVAVVEVTSLDPPSLARDGHGDLVVRARVTATDLEPFGTGSAGYDPACATGLLLARRQIGANELVSSIHATGIHP